MTKWAELPEWQRRRAELLHEVCQWIESQIAEGQGKMKAFRLASARWDKTPLNNGHCATRTLCLSAGKHGGSTRRLFERWLGGSKSATDFVQHFTTPAGRQIPGELIIEWRKRLTVEGKQFASRVYKDLKREWVAGVSVPGLGTWQEWWKEKSRLETAPTETAPTGTAPTGTASTGTAPPTPTKAPDFPFSYSSLIRYSPAPVARALAEKGIAAAREVIAHIQRDSSALRPCEVYTLDDKDLDLMVIDDVFGSMRLVRPTIYIMMDMGPRYVAGFVLRPAKATAFDVDALIAHVLSSHGVGNGYITHILFERGTVACSPAREEYFQKLFPGQLFVHRTGMIKGYARAGAYADAATGKPCSKGMIEALMYKLDILLSKQQGQIGNRYQNLPAAAEARQRSSQDLAVIEQATGAKLEFPNLRLSKLNDVLRDAIHDYNHDPEHGCQGFHRRLQVEAQPGVWHDVPEAFSGNGRDGARPSENHQGDSRHRPRLLRRPGRRRHPHLPQKPGDLLTLFPLHFLCLRLCLWERFATAIPSL